MPSIIASRPCWFWVIAIVVSAYYGFRGLLIEMRAAGDEDIQRQRDGKAPWPKWQRVFVHYVHKLIFNFIGSFTGFFALILAFKVYETLGPQPKVETGTAVLLTFLGLLAITGMTGILPEMLYQGGIFGPKP